MTSNSTPKIDKQAINDSNTGSPTLEQTICNSNIESSTVKQTFIKHNVENLTVNLTIDNDIGIDNELFKQLKTKNANEKLLNNLLTRVLNNWKEAFLKSDLVECKRLIDTVFVYGVYNLKEDLQQKFYLIIFTYSIEKNEDSNWKACLDNLVGKYKEEAELVNRVINKEAVIGNDEMIELPSYLQSCILNSWQKNEKYNLIIDRMKLNSNLNDSEIIFVWKRYAAISYFNTQDYEDAMNAFEDAFSIKEYPFDKVFFLICRCLIQYFESDKNWKQKLADYDSELDYYLKEHHEFGNSPNKDLIQEICLQNAFKLDKALFIKRYEVLSEQDKNKASNAWIYGYYLETRGDFQGALQVYGKIKNQLFVYIHMMICYISQNQWDQAIKIYRSHTEYTDNEIMTGIYLEALFYTNKDLFRKEVMEAVEKYKNDIGKLFYIAMSLSNDVDLFNELITPLFGGFDFQRTKTLSEEQKFLYSQAFMNAGSVNLCKGFLHSCNNLSNINVNYFEQFEMVFSNNKLLNDFEKIEISSVFLENKIDQPFFLRVQINCYVKQREVISAIKSSQQLCRLTNDERDIRVLLLLVIKNDPTSLINYGSYLNVLENSLNQQSLIILSEAYLCLDKIEDAKRIIYKALMINDEDPSALNSYAKIMLNIMLNQNKKIKQETAEIDTVVGLKNDKLTKYICIENRDVSISKNSNVYNVEHISAPDSLYYAILHKKVDQTFEYKGDIYTVVSIENKYTKALQYVMNYLTKHPEVNFLPLKVITSNSPEKMVHEVIDIMKSDDEEYLLDLYHEKKNAIRLPIDVIAQTYDNYVNTVKYLLYVPDQALYTGVAADIPRNNSQKFVVSLSTLVILAEMNQLDLLKPIIDQIIIPTCLLQFINERIEYEIRADKNIPGKLYKAHDGTIGFLPHDKTIRGLWEKIRDFCLKLHNTQISDDDLLKLPKLEGHSIESIFNGLKLHRIQIETMALAYKIDAIYLSDDEFFRTFANYLKIKNANISSLIWWGSIKVGNEICSKLAIKLSKTNYIYIPIANSVFILLSQEEQKEILDNIQKGKYKKKYYGIILSRIKSVYQSFIDSISAIKE